MTEPTTTQAQALLQERESYVARGLKDRVAQVDAKLAELGIGADDGGKKRKSKAKAKAPETATNPPVVETANGPASGSIAEVLDRVGTDSALAAEALGAEQAKGDKARGSLVTKLTAIAESAA